MKFYFFPYSLFDQFGHTCERKASLLYIIRIMKMIKCREFFPYAIFISVVKINLPLLFVQIFVSGTGATPLATGNTASTPESYGHSTICTLTPRPKNKDRRTVPRHPAFNSPSAQRASSNR
jgi:hypothetical protein